MSFFRGNETVLIKRRAASSVDEYGNKTHTLTTVTVKNVLIGFGSTSEPVDPNRDPIDATITLYLPNGTQVMEGDRFIVRNTEWVKDGSAQDWGTENPLGLDAGGVVNVRKRNG